MDNGDIGIECFAAQLWDQQVTMDLSLEELSYGTAALCIHPLSTSFTVSVISSRGYCIRSRHGHDRDNAPLVSYGNGSLPAHNEESAGGARCNAWH